jgi:hypothetical protein
VTDARARFDELRQRASPIRYDVLDEFWSTLAPVSVEFMIGEWKGGDLPTGHRGDGFLGDRWFGTTFTSATDVQPIICVDADGNKYEDTTLMNGGASLWMEEFRGEVTATMVYDGMAVFDHFKRVGPETLIGVMNGKGVLDKGEHYWFVLDRDAD